MKFGIYPNLGKKDLKMALERLTALLRDKNIDYSLPLSMKKGLMDMGFTEDTYETDESMGKGILSCPWEVTVPFSALPAHSGIILSSWRGSIWEI